MTTPWRNDPLLQGKLLPDHPDDLQVVAHDGEPRRTQRNPEVCWVHITRVAGSLRSPIAPPGATPPLSAASVQWVERTVYEGQLLNAPHQLTSVRQGATVRFVHAPGLPHPLLVTAEYERERASWAFTPCDRCGADQALDAPSVMARTRFPQAPAGAVPVAFSAFCPCGGTMLLTQIEGAPAPSMAPRPGSAFGSSGPMGGSFTAPSAPTAQATTSSGSSGLKPFLIAGVGCLGLVSMCCLSGVGAFFFQRGGHESVATAHAERFLGLVQQRQWSGALAAAEYMGGGDSLYSADVFGACLQSTPLSEMTAFTCPSASSEWPLDNRADAVCTITTARGASEITIGVNSTDGQPYLGYVWFSADAPTGTAWHGDDCARWSGRDYYGETPASRVRP